MIAVSVSLKNTSQAIELEGIKNTYVKGPFYCLEAIGNDGVRRVQKYPLDDIFRVTEEYGRS